MWSRNGGRHDRLIATPAAIDVIIRRVGRKDVVAGRTSKPNSLRRVLAPDARVELILYREKLRVCHLGLAWPDDSPPRRWATTH